MSASVTTPMTPNRVPTSIGLKPRAVAYSGSMALTTVFRRLAAKVANISTR